MPQQPRFKLFCTDAFDWLKVREGNNIHAVVTDPPYGLIEYTPDQLLKRRSGSGGIWRVPRNFDGHRRSPMPRFTVLRRHHHEEISRFHNQLAALLLPVLVPGAHVFLASQNLLSHLVITEFLKAGFEMRGQVARIVRTLRGGDRPKGAHRDYPNLSVIPRSCWEPWLIFRKPCEGRVKDNLAKWNTGALRRPRLDSPFCDLIQSFPANGIERKLAPHPSLKPQAFLRQLVWSALPCGEGTILDPFMGSGSVIAAADHLVMKSIGLEINREYFLMAKGAISKLSALEVMQGKTRNTSKE